MLTPGEADAAIAATLALAATERVPLPACVGRVLREPVHAERDAPPFDRVTMDGIAIASIAFGQRDFRIAGVQAAGAAPLTLPGPTDCIEVMTGAVLPAGCDTIVPVERLTVANGLATIDPDLALQAGQFVHRRAADAQSGERLLAPGIRLGAPEIAIAASAGLTGLEVSRQARIAIISTGDELIEPGQPIAPHQVRRSNTHGLAAALRGAGFAAATDLHLPDDPATLEAGLARMLDRHDVLVLSGGVSAGRFDHVPSALASQGVRKVFHHVAQRPGRPMWFGARAGGALVFALPGNPVSVLVCLVRYVIPALIRRAGALPPLRAMFRLSRDYPFPAPLSCFLPVSLRYDPDGTHRAEPRPTGGSGDFISLAGTDGFVELPPGPAIHPAGLGLPFLHW
jgi:molybdopterin molybdotransferase